MALENNEKDIEKDDAEIEEDDVKLFITVSSPVAGFAMGVEHYLRQGYDLSGPVIPDVQNGVLTFHQCLIFSSKIKNNRRKFRKYKLEILQKLRKEKEEIESIKLEIENAKLEFHQAGNSFSGFLKWLFKTEKKSVCNKCNRE